MKRSIGNKDFDVYKRVRECAECSDQFATYEIADEALDRIIDHLTNGNEAQLEKFKASVIAEITKLKLTSKN